MSRIKAAAAELEQQKAEAAGLTGELQQQLAQLQKSVMVNANRPSNKRKA